MRARWIFALALGLAFLASVSSGAEYSSKDRSFKEKNLRSLQPYGPGFNEERRPIWTEFIRMAALYEDYDIVARMFELRKRTDGAIAEQYSLDLFELYKKNPLFFVRSVDRYYKGDFKAFLPVWINGVQDVTREEVRQVAKGVSKNALMDAFLKSLDSMPD